MYPTMSKNKSSFRIEDILHQQQTDSQLLAHHLMLKNGHQKHSIDFKSDIKNRSNESKHSNDLSNSPSPDTSSLAESTSSPSHQINNHNNKSSNNNNVVGGSSSSKNNDFPMKPTPMYSNFQLPFPLGIHPAFHPAAYLNYADAIHKGE